MDVQTIIKGWKNKQFGMSLPVSLLPQNPAGEIRLSDEDLLGTQSEPITTSPLCMPSFDANCPVGLD